MALPKDDYPSPDKYRLHTARKIRRVRRLVRRGASNRKVYRASERAATAINRAQAQGTYGSRAKKQTQRTIKTLRRDESLYSKRAAGNLRSARRPQINPTPNKPKNRPSPGPDTQHPDRKPGSDKPGPRNQHPRDKDKPKNKPKKNPPKDKKKSEYKPLKLGKPGRKLRRRLTNVTENRFLKASPKAIDRELKEYRKRRKRIVKKVHGLSEKKERKVEKKRVTAAKKRIRERIEGPEEKKREAEAIQAARKRIKKKVIGEKEKEAQRLKAARKNLIKEAREKGTGATGLHRKAGLAVSAELDPQLKALRSRIRQERRNRKRTLADLRGIYQRAGEQHKGHRESANKGAQADLETTKNAYERLTDKLSSDYGASTTAVQNELERLGLSSASEASLSGLNRDKQYALSQAGISGEEATSAQRTDKQGFNQLMSLLGGELRAQGLGARTTARQAFTDEIMGLKDQRSALAATRLGKISTAVEALRAARASARSEAIQNQLAQRLAEREFGLDVAKFKQDVRESNREHRLNRKKYDLDLAEFLAEQMNSKKLKPRRDYANSRNGAIDFLRDRGLKDNGINTYMRFVKSAGKAGKVKGPFGIPIPIPTHMIDNDNQKVRLMMRQLIKKGVKPELARAYATALKIEWGLI